VAQQRLHDPLHALCPGRSAPVGHGRALKLEGVIGQAVLSVTTVGVTDTCGSADQLGPTFALSPAVITTAGLSHVRGQSHTLGQVWPPKPDEALESELQADLARPGAAYVNPPRPVPSSASEGHRLAVGPLKTADGTWLGWPPSSPAGSSRVLNWGGIPRRICAPWTDQAQHIRDGA
jgi:hypothetical protein